MLSEGFEEKVGMETKWVLRAGNDIVTSRAILRRGDAGGEIELKGLPIVGKGDHSGCSAGYLYAVETS